MLAQPVERHYDGVLGTSLDLSIHAPDAARAERAIAAALAEIERLDAILSTWREESAIMQLNRERNGENLPPELIEVVELCETWRERSANVFTCRLGKVARIWQQAQEEQKLPVAKELLDLSRQIAQAELAIDAERRAIALGEDIELEPSGLAKGYIIDRAMAVLRAQVPDATAIKLDIGGDAVYWGAPPETNGWDVLVADPELTADNGAFIAKLSLAGKAVATSGHSSRTFTIGRLNYSHIFDSRRGWPTSESTYAVASADDAVTADAIATILAAQSLDNGLKWAQEHEQYAQVLLVNKQNRVWHSAGWVDLLGGDMRRQLRAEISFNMEYTIPRLKQRPYERPYVAIWISDRQGNPLRNLLLLGQDQRWASSNSLWWRRVGSRTRLATLNVTRPTRGPGEYQLTWDGKDESGASLLEGDYVLNVEAVSRYGNHDYVAQPFTIEPGSQRYENPGEREVGPFSFTLEVTPPEEN